MNGSIHRLKGLSSQTKGGKEMKKMTQCDRIIDHMRKYGSITSMEAINSFGCTRLPARISDIKKQGYAVVKEMETGKNRYGEKTSYARYRLEA